MSKRHTQPSEDLARKAVFSVSEKIRIRVHNLPDPTHPPLDYDEQTGFERVYPYLHLPVLQLVNHGDTVIFSARGLPPTYSHWRDLSRYMVGGKVVRVMKKPRV